MAWDKWNEEHKGSPKSEYVKKKAKKDEFGRSLVPIVRAQQIRNENKWVREELKRRNLKV